MDIHQQNKTALPLPLKILPIDLLALPLVLILLAVLPSAWAMLALLLIMLVTVLILGGRGQLKGRLLGFVRLGLVSLLFLGLSYQLSHFIACKLSQQTLWLACFVLGFGANVLYKHISPRMTQEEDEAECCCSQKRRKILEAEYKRFDRQLLGFALIALVISAGLMHWASDLPSLDLISSSLLAVLSLGLIAMEVIRLHWVQRELRSEYWITVLDEEDKPQSCISLSHRREAKGRLPLVRLVAYSQGMVYLEHTACLVSSAEHYDTPFCAWVHMGLSPTLVAQRLIDQRFCGIKQVRPRHLLRYLHEIEDQRLVVYLYAVEIEQPDLLLVDCKPIHGKWWQMSQLRPQIHQSDFSPLLKEEIPMLEQTVLLAQQLKGQA